ncbi:glycolate oxidase subunit GlcE [Candidatus Methylomicrobium oryzae]|uniref:glycolate oxidase subunit GlcE n=1 Tax=Candidatus Methylomicrobium oryzae TaxID=2802053 RepID=UPI001921D2DE|nr:glycolate oxidase subunit GlcE [Methylomicrobium sp. RS1]MBL1264592.1 glycolate oxidase subunit GlcE [Methylomicrobium sp. RS1]
MSVSANDQTLKLQQAVAQALAHNTPLNIRGGGSKAFYGRAASGEPLCLREHCGIVNYHPSELVVTARTGTLLTELERILAEESQMLAFEPPHFGETATLGGTIACGFSGPRRPFAGSARDSVLGCRIINGKAEVLSFGGEVIKNVAGFDVSRLMAGAMGTLGVLLEVSLKVLPQPEAERTCRFELPVFGALDRMARLASEPLPVSGLSYDGCALHVRLSGAEKAVRVAAARIGGDQTEDDGGYWRALNEQRLDFFRAETNVWRLSLPPASQPLALSGDWFYDWAGGLRWLKTDEPAEAVFTAAERARGHAVLFKGRNRGADVFQPLTGKLKELNRNIKQAFDPGGLFNPQRMYRDW